MVMGIAGENVRQARRFRRDRGSERGCFIVDGKGVILGFDQGMEGLTGWRATDVVGRHKDTPRLRSGDGQLSSASSALPLYEGAIAAPSRSERWPLLLGCRNGEFLEVESLVRRLPGPGDRFAVEVLDVVACIGRSTAPGEASEHDPLTRLHGRAEFLASLKREFQRAVENSAPLALVLLDVDHLRRVNDTLGRRAGDDVLRKLAGILRATVGDRGTGFPQRPVRRKTRRKTPAPPQRRFVAQ
jgi:GGDEF domain-containing protein